MKRFVSFYFFLVLAINRSKGQTEGDTGYVDESYDRVYDDNSVIGIEPMFVGGVRTVTQVVNSSVILPCAVRYLGQYKVLWRDPALALLYYEDRKIIEDLRISMVRPSVPEWNLQIQALKLEDQGVYTCAVNTVPVKNTTVVLVVAVPATINKSTSSKNTVAILDSKVKLTCKAEGIPRPNITWTKLPIFPGYQRSEEQCHYKVYNGNIGSVLIMEQVSRHCEGTFECTADNGISPAPTHALKLTIEFAPRINLTNDRLHQAVGRETILNCIIVANPHASNYWERNGRRVTNSFQYYIDAIEEPYHVMTLQLKVYKVSDNDFGAYKCVAANKYGRDEKSMMLIETPEPRYKSHASPNLERETSKNPAYKHQNPPKTKAYKPHQQYLSSDFSSLGNMPISFQRFVDLNRSRGLYGKEKVTIFVGVIISLVLIYYD